MPVKRIAVVLVLIAAPLLATPRKLALLIGINDYTASHLSAIRAPAPGREWPNLAGAVNDTVALRELLVLLRGFDAGDIVTLNDQAATRAAILAAANRLAATAAKDDVVFVYFAGHGSQVRNSDSDELDKLDEAIVPADSRRGALDIRDKELRRIFNAILDRGARLTVMIDACHSGSGARGLLTAARPRGIKPDLRDVADGGPFGPRPENRGALVIAAAHDEEEARETRGGQAMHGAFTWAWMRAMRDAAPDETAMETFVRAQALLRAEMPFQNPVIAGDVTPRRLPFLGARPSTRAAHATFAVERIRSDGIAVISGGWAHGITEGSELRPFGDRTHPPLTVTALLGLGRCEARLPPNAHVRPGMLLVLSGWAAPPPQPLRVAIPRAAMDVAAFARRISVATINDPTTRTPDRVLRRNGAHWELLDRAGHVTAFASDDDAMRVVNGLRGALFVQLPASTALASQLADLGPVELVQSAEEADYVLAGRFVRNHLEYAWVRPNARNPDRRATGLPLRTTWITATGDLAVILRDAALRLHKIAAWNRLESPPDSHWPYRLALRRPRDGQLVADRVDGDQTYALELHATARAAMRRHVYVFAIDSYGRSTLLFPVSGSVENHLPLAGEPLILLGAKFEVTPPYGVDTYMLLSTDEPLANPWILQWDGVRAPAIKPTTALERLIALTGTSGRGARVVTPATWSIERMAIESVRPRHKRTSSVSSSVRPPRDAGRSLARSDAACRDGGRIRHGGAMGFYLHKSVAVGPFRFNLSGSGIGMSVGVRGLRVGSGPRGNYVRIGRGGVFYQQSFHAPAALPPTPPIAIPGGTHAPMQEIASANAAQIADSSSEQLLSELREKRAVIRLLPFAVVASALLLLYATTLPAWAFTPCAAAALAAIALAHRRDVLRKTTVILYDVAADIEASLRSFAEWADALVSCRRAWHVSAEGRVYDRKYHAGAASLVRRNATAVRRAAPPFVRTNVPVLSIAAGGRAGRRHRRRLHLALRQQERRPGSPLQQQPAHPRLPLQRAALPHSVGAQRGAPALAQRHRRGLRGGAASHQRVIAPQQRVDDPAVDRR